MSRRRGVLWWLLGSLGLLGLLACIAVYAWFGYFGPQMEIEQRREVFAALGTPEGFARDEPQLVGTTDRLAASYSLTCDRGACPADLGARVHRWLVAGGKSDASAPEVTRCLDNQRANPTSMCALGWRTRNCEVYVQASYRQLPGNRGTDRQVRLLTTVGDCD
ncbi:hypothetical protein [Micromonospora zhanjiangensis]|uniref:Uncharacterized protein n=1 Tax=Micromonospora zhanjiangensis TaxID=1522057 RepID=A0ABV8KN75_9ACTN